MATNDWKSELKRRIKDIRDRKEEEQKLESRTKKYTKPAAKARTVPFPKQAEPESVVEPEEAVSEALIEEPTPEEPIAEAVTEEEVIEPVAAEIPEPVEVSATATEEVVEPEPKLAKIEAVVAEEAEETVEADDGFDPESLLEEVGTEVAAAEQAAPEPEVAIFQTDEAEETVAVDRDEEAIRAQLARLSGSPKKTKAKKQEEPTLFPVEEKKAPAADQRVRMKATPAKDVPEPAKAAKQKPEPSPTTEAPKKQAAAATASSNMDNLDAAIDQYIPADTPDENAKHEQAERPKRPAATVVDKTVRNMCFKRIAAAVFDIALMLGLVAAVVWISSMIVQSGPLSLLSSSILPFSAFAVALHFLYYVIFTATTGQTLGKAILRLRVVGKSPGTIGLWQATLRWIVGLGGTAFALLGYLTMFLTSDGAAVQDIALQHRVRRTKKAE